VLVIDVATGRVLRHERYDEQSFGMRRVISMFALHSGSLFGIVGRVVFMAASLVLAWLMLSGALLYARKRRRPELALTRRLRPLGTEAPQELDEVAFERTARAAMRSQEGA